MITCQKRRAAVILVINRSLRFLIPGRALHEKGLQRQIGDGTLVNSQQRRALAVPVINRGWTGCQPRVNRTFCSFAGLHRNSFVRACEESFRTIVYIALESPRGGWLPRRPKCRHLVLPSVAPPRCRPAPCPPDPPVVCPGFGLDRLDLCRYVVDWNVCR